MSRPIPSTPNQAILLGPTIGMPMSSVRFWLMSPGVRWITRWENRGADNARITKMSTMKPAPIATRSRLNRIQKSCQGVRPSTLPTSASGGIPRGWASGSIAWTWLTESVAPLPGRGECRALFYPGQPVRTYAICPRDSSDAEGLPHGPEDLGTHHLPERPVGARPLAVRDRAVG